MKVIEERTKIIKDLEKIYKLALENQDYSNAIQAKKAIAGILNEMKRQNSEEEKKISLQELSYEQLSALINSLQS